MQAQRKSAILKPLFSLDGPLAGFLSRLYGWCEEIGNDFERMAVAMRRKLPTSTVFSHKTVNGSYTQFETLFATVRAAHVEARRRHECDERDDSAWRTFDESVEELIWATEWVHMTLARRPGD